MGTMDNDIKKTISAFTGAFKDSGLTLALDSLKEAALELVDSGVYFLELASENLLEEEETEESIKYKPSSRDEKLDMYHKKSSKHSSPDFFEELEKKLRKSLPDFFGDMK